MRWTALVIVLVALLAAVAWAASRAGPSRDLDPAPDRRWAAVLATADLTVPGGTMSGMDEPVEFQGDQGQSSEAVVNVQILRRRFDWTRVPMDDARGGPVEAILAQGRVHEEALRRAGFQTMLSETFGAGGEPLWALPDGNVHSLGSVPPPPPPPDRPGVAPRHRPRVDVRSVHRSDSGGGGGVGHVSLDRPRIVQERIYVVPRSGATLFVRCEYVQAERTLEVEFRYVDRTILGVEYPTGGHIVGREPGGYSAEESIAPATGR